MQQPEQNKSQLKRLKKNRKNQNSQPMLNQARDLQVGQGLGGLEISEIHW